MQTYDSSKITVYNEYAVAQKLCYERFNDIKKLRKEIDQIEDDEFGLKLEVALNKNNYRHHYKVYLNTKYYTKFERINLNKTDPKIFVTIYKTTCDYVFDEDGRILGRIN